MTSSRSSVREQAEQESRSTGGLGFYAAAGLGLRVVVSVARMERQKLVPTKIFQRFGAHFATGNWGSFVFCSAPRESLVLGVFCARFPPRRA